MGILKYLSFDKFSSRLQSKSMNRVEANERNHQRTNHSQMSDSAIKQASVSSAIKYEDCDDLAQISEFKDFEIAQKNFDYFQESKLSVKPSPLTENS